MKYKILFSESARNDLKQIVMYIAFELLEPNIAFKLSERILDAIKTLDDFPKRNKLCGYETWKSKGLRVMPIENYLVFYLVDDINKVVQIYRIFYCKRDIKKHLK